MEIERMEEMEKRENGFLSKDKMTTTPATKYEDLLNEVNKLLELDISEYEITKPKKSTKRRRSSGVSSNKNSKLESTSKERVAELADASANAIDPVAAIDLDKSQEEEKEKALFCIEVTKYMIRSKDYQGARLMAKKALKLSPSIQNGNQILTITEILFYGVVLLRNHGIDWYWLLQLTLSSTELELRSRCEDLIKVIEQPMEVEFPGTQSALLLVKEAMAVLCNKDERAVYDHKRKVSGYFDDKLFFSSEMVMKSGFKNYDLLLFCLSQQLRSVRDQVFGAFPQNPHYKPLSNYCRDVQDGMKLGLDSVFINLSLKIQKLMNPQQFWTEVEDLNAQVTQLDDMGYNVVKLRERLDALKRIAEQNRADEEEIKRMEAKEHDGECLILLLEEEIKQLRKRVAGERSEVEGFKSMAKRIKGDSNKNLNEFSNVAQSAWK